MFGNFATALALKELSSALGTLDAPHSSLPDVKDKDGESIQDAKEKRLALVRQHVQAAGDIISLQEQVNAQAQMAISQALAMKYKDKIKGALQGAPPELLEALDGLMEGGGDCDCPACKPNEEPARQFGFGKHVR